MLGTRLGAASIADESVGMAEYEVVPVALKVEF